MTSAGNELARKAWRRARVRPCPRATVSARGRGWVSQLLVAVTALIALMPAAPAADDADGWWRRAAPPLSGAELLRLCGGPEASGPTTAPCAAYVAGVIGMLDGAGRSVDAASFCVPPQTGLDDLVALYRSESRLYPDVLDVPAARLIAGMLLKFYPCQSARSIAPGSPRASPAAV